MTAQIPTVRASDLPAVTRAQMAEVDRLMIEEYGIQLLQMMENAGLQLAQLVRHELGRLVDGGRIVVLAGRGNNGGGGIAAARRLAAWGADVSIILTDSPEAYVHAPAQQLAIVRKMGVRASAFTGALPPHDLLVDAVIGYGLDGSPRGAARELIVAANQSPSPIVSLDVPSGLDADTGVAAGEAIRAASTLTLALPKTGLLRPAAGDFVGRLYLGDISVPAGLYERLGLSAPQVFSEGPLVKILG